MTKEFEKFQTEVPRLRGRIEEVLHRAQTFTYEGNEFEVAQYRIHIKDSGRLLAWVAVVTFLHDRPEPQKQIKLPPTGYAFTTQWVVAKEVGYDNLPS